MRDRAVLLMAYGTVDQLCHMQEYLQDIAGGRPPTQELLVEMTRRYELVGGSPLTRITLQQAAALEHELQRRGKSRRVYVGMRHWEPRIRSTVARMAADGIRQAVGIVMAPHYSSFSIGRYRQRLVEALDTIPGAPDVRLVERWWREPQLQQAIQERICEALPRRGARCDSVHVVFTAHSLPVRARELGDPYETEVRAHAALLAESLNLLRWSFAFQSAGTRGEAWLGPSLDEELARLAAGDVRHVLVAPIGFVCDHVEVLYDLDVEACRFASELGLDLWRTESLNLSAALIAALADVVEAAEEAE